MSFLYNKESIALINLFSDSVYLKSIMNYRQILANYRFQNSAELYSIKSYSEKFRVFLCDVILIVKLNSINNK